MVHTVAIAVCIAGLAAAQATAVAPGASPAVERPRVLVLEPSGEAVDASTRGTVASLVSIELARRPTIDVVASSDVKKMAALEAEKQTLGCDDEGSCLAELAGAMGARYVVFGDIAKLGTLTIVNLSLFDSQRARAVGRVAIQVQGLEELPQRLPGAVAELLRGAPDLGEPLVAAAPAGYGDGDGRPNQAAVVAEPGGAPLWATIGMWSLIGAGALVGAGALAFDLTSSTSSDATLDGFDVVGPAGLAVGLAAVGGGVALGVLAPSEVP